MSTLSVRLPESLHRNARRLAKAEGVSLNALISSALGEKMSALETGDYLAKRAAKGSRDKFLAVLRKVPPAEPEPHDKR